MRYNQNPHPPLLIVTNLQNFGQHAILPRKVLEIQNMTQAPSCNVPYINKYPQVVKKRLPFCFCNLDHRMVIVMEVIQ